MSTSTRSAHDQHSLEQFSPRAEAYASSAVHANGADLEALEDIARGYAAHHALDVGCGAGHVAFRLARHVDQVVACDPSTAMLGTVAETARARGIDNLTTACAPAQALPFPDQHFDFLSSRFSLHHWDDAAAGVRECRRVVKDGSVAVFIDVVGHDTPLIDVWLQSMELLRDTSHVRDASPQEWQALLHTCGFTPMETRSYRLRLEFESWVARMQTPPTLVAALRALQQRMPQEVAKHLELEPDGSFTVDTQLIVARAA